MIACSIYQKIISSAVVLLVGLMFLFGHSGYMVGADQLLIADRLTSSPLQTTVPPAPLMDPSPGNLDTQELNDVDMVTELHNSLRFEPSKLDFGSWSIGVARSHTVTLVNQNANKSVYLSSVSGKTPAFYSSFFEAKMVPPQGNTTFNVVFLPRTSGAVSTSLLIHTSFGQAKLLVSGEGRECPYKLKPILGIKAPLNATLTPEVLMYNPHSYPIQIIEVYSSGGQFQLELPSGGSEGPKALWEIPPYATKPVIRIRFKGDQAGNHTAFIRIKVAGNESMSTNENVVVIPVEFEILPNRGLYAENPIIDFRQLTTYDKIKHQKIQLTDSLNSLDHKPLLVDYQLRQVPGLTFNMKEATISLDPQKFLQDTRLEELLVIRTGAQRNATELQEFTLLIRAEVFRGNLKFDENVTVFVTKSEHFVRRARRSLVVSNKFTLPLTIVNVAAEHNDSSVLLMTVNGVTLSQVLQPNASAEVLALELVNEGVHFRSVLHIDTNITTFSVPVVVCTGMLHVQTLDVTQEFVFADYNTHLDLGIVPFADMSHDGFIVLQNRNPLSVKLASWDFKAPQGVHFHTTFLGCLRGPMLKSLKAQEKLMLDTSIFKFCTHIGEDDIAAFQIAIKSYITDLSTGSLMIWTPFEEITAKVSFKTWIGKLEVDQQQVYFKNCFPGKVCSSDLSIRSTFLKPVRITSVNFTDKGLTFKDSETEGSWIAPQTTTKVGRIYFEPAKLCETRCYIPQNNEKSSEVAFPVLNHGNKGSSNHYFDETELRRRTELFRYLKWYYKTMSFTLNSNEIRQFQLHLIIDIEWPKLIKGRQVFPTIEVGKTQIVQLNVTNPASQPILIDYFLSDPKFSKDTQMSLPLEVVDICTSCFLTDKDVFTLPDGAPKKPLLVPAASSMSVSVHFLAKEADTYSTLLHIRNNLTLYEAVWLTARSVQSQFKFGNRKPGSNTPLLFDVNEKHLSACTNSDTPQKGLKAEHVTVVTKRTFTARNTGEIPIWIETFMIGDQMCEGFGFKILDCSSFALQANSSKKIEIGFSPDFTAARVSRALTLITNLSYDVSYLLVAVMPPVSLDQCYEMLPRPPWEARYKVVTFVVVGTSFILVMVAAQIDYANLLAKQEDLFVARDKGPVQPTFNLRNIAVKPTTTNTVDQQASRSTLKPCKLQVKANGNNFSSIKKRGAAKKVSCNNNGGGRNMSLSEMTWPVEFSELKEEKAEKGARAAHSLSERSFPLKLETEKGTHGQSPTNSSTSISSSESSAKSASPKQVEKAENNAQNTVTNGSRRPKSLRKAKKLTQTASNESNENETRTATLPKATSRSPKQAAKSSGDNASAAKIKTPTDGGRNSEPEGNEAAVKRNIPNSSDANAGGRKYGKTPGRERKKESAESSSVVGSKRSERKMKNKAFSSLNLNSSPVRTESKDMSAFNSFLSPWSTNPSSIASFSHVLQSQQHPSSNENSSDLIKNSGLELQSSGESLSPDVSFPQTTSKLMNNDLEKEIYESYNKIEVANSAELGPIGTRRSPSSTPVWEPLSGTNTNSSSASNTELSQNSSFFSNILPPYDYSESQGQQLIGLQHTGLYEMKTSQEEFQRQWQASDYLFSLRQQQILPQAPLQKTIEPGNWAVASRTWTPMSYRQSAASATTSAGNNSNMAVGPWQRTTTIRPPPGLEQNFQSNPRTAASRHSTQAAATNDSAIANANSEDVHSMQTFDPFSSLSSIWSENWNKNRNEMN